VRPFHDRGNVCARLNVCLLRGVGIMRFRLALLLATGLAAVSPARADVLIHIDKSAQFMTVTVDGSQRYAWPVSTGIADYDTPDGEFQAFRA